MALQDELNGLKARSEGRTPPRAFSVMRCATQDLEKSGLARKALKAGDRASDFALKNMDGALVNLQDLLE